LTSGKVLADPRQLGKVIAVMLCGLCSGRRDAERVCAVELEEIGKLFQVARDIGVEDGIHRL
jgi:hypothetical protein